MSHRAPRERGARVAEANNREPPSPVEFEVVTMMILYYRNCYMYEFANGRRNDKVFKQVGGSMGAFLESGCPLTYATPSTLVVLKVVGPHNPRDATSE